MEVSKFIIDDNEVYVKDAEGRNLIAGLSDDVTTAQNTADGAQSAAEAAQRTANDALNGLAGKQNAITYNGAYTGNIDDISNISIAFCSASSVSGTLPYSTGYFMLETFKADNGATYIQKAYKYGGSDGIPSISYRIYANGQWYPWKSVTLS